MKNIFKNFSLALLALTVIGTFAFTKAPVKKATFGTLYVFNPTGAETEFSPNAYDPDPLFDPSNTGDCPGATTKVCAIETTEIYTSGTFIGQPKVDDNDAAAPSDPKIDDHIVFVQGNPSVRDGATDANGNRVWVRN